MLLPQAPVSAAGVDDVDSVVAAALPLLAAEQLSVLSRCMVAERLQDDGTVAAVTSWISFLQHPTNVDQSV